MHAKNAKKYSSTITRNIIIYSIQDAFDNKQLPVSKPCTQLKVAYDATKEPSNQQLQVHMLGSSIKHSLLSRQTRKIWLQSLP